MSDQDSPVRDESPGNADSEERKRKIRSAVSQILASTAKNIILFMCGLSMGIPTVIIPEVYNASSNSTLTLTQEEVSWFGSVNFVATPLGSIISGTLSQTFGRKRSMQALTIPLLISFVILYYADSALMLCAGVALGGLVVGMLEAPVLTYISEISEARLRGILSASAPVSSIFGVFVVYLMGTFIEWRLLSLICGLLNVLAFTVMFFVPESPYWLLSKNRFDDTKKSLRWLRGWTTEEHIREEYEQLVMEIRPDERVVPVKTCSFDVEKYMKRTFVSPFLLIMFTFAAGYFTGITSISTYAVNIFNSFGAPIDGYRATVMFGLARLSGTIACMALIHYTGKRPLAFISTAAIAALFTGVGLYGYLYLGLEKMDNGDHVNEKFDGVPNYSWFPMVCFIGGSFFGYLGIRILPWSIIGEIFPTESRSVSSGISAGLGYLMGFVANKTFFDLLAVFKLYGIFFLYAGISVFSLVVFYVWLPETEGWSLVEVQEHFAGKRNLIKAGIKKNDTKQVESSNPKV